MPSLKWLNPLPTFCGTPETTARKTYFVETFLSLTIHQMVESTCTFRETLKPRSIQKPKWFRQQPYIHSIYRNSIVVVEDTKVSPYSRSHFGWKHQKPTRRLKYDLISTFQTWFYPGIVKSIHGFNSQNIGIQHAISSKYCNTTWSNMASPLEPRPILLYSYSALILQCIIA